MTFIQSDTTEVSLAELHELDADDFNVIIIEVRRRPTPGAGPFSGTQFLTCKESAARFESVDGALEFIDDLQTGGIETAIRNSSVDQLTDEDVVDRLRYANPDKDPQEYLEQAGLTDPFNLDIIPQIETTEPVELDDPATATDTAEPDIEV